MNEVDLEGFCDVILIIYVFIIILIFFDVAIRKRYAQSCQIISMVWLLVILDVITCYFLFVVVAIKITLTVWLDLIVFYVSGWFIGVWFEIDMVFMSYQFFEIRSVRGSTTMVFMSYQVFEIRSVR